MTKLEVLNQYGWLIALTVSVGVISWTGLLLQALFHDKRIGIVGVFGSLLVAFIAVFPQWVPYADFFKVLTAIVCVIFIVWFLFTHFKKPAIFLPVIGIVFSLSVGYWLYQSYQLAA
ncbi:MAG: hypothetical protein ACSHWU_01310 [Marinicella sp.]